MWALSQMLPPFPKPFLNYYDDALTGAMVREVFFVGVTDTVVELSPGVMGSDEFFQIPADCFKNATKVAQVQAHEACLPTVWPYGDGCLEF